MPNPLPVTKIAGLAVVGGAATLAAAALLYPAPEISRPPVAPSVVSAHITQLGWERRSGEENDILIVHYTTREQGPRHASMVAPAAAPLAAWAASEVAAVKDYPGTKLTFLNRSVVGSEHGMPGMLHVGRDRVLPSRTEPISPLSFGVSDLPPKIRALVAEIDESSKETVKMDVKRE